MSIIAFPERFKNYTEALKSDAVIKTNGSIDGIENLFDDMSTTGYYDSDDICYMFLKVLPEPYVVGALSYNTDATYFISNRLINMLIDEVGDDRSQYGNFKSAVEAFAANEIGDHARTELGSDIELHFIKLP